MRAAYPEPVWQLFCASPRVGRLDPGPGVGRGRGGSRREGGEVEVWLAVAGGEVREARFLAWGCPYTVALAAASTARLGGVSLAAALEFQAGELVETLGIPPDRWAARVWIEDAVRAAARAAQETRG